MKVVLRIALWPLKLGAIVLAIPTAVVLFALDLPVRLFVAVEEWFDELRG